MNTKRKIFRIVAFFGLCLVLLGINLSCGQYDYSSPLPGIVSLHLHSIVDTTQMNFTPLDNFVIKVAQINVIRSDGAQAIINADLSALQRTTSIYNTLDTRARDSSLVVGESYLPPGDYVSVGMLIQAGTQVVLDGYRDIRVTLDPSVGAAIFFKRPFHIAEGQRTTIILTLDLSKSLIKQVDTYIFDPVYSISSIQYE
ncbi:MAG TPA: DUF4382 domain-containing protein [Bacteroidota bacterium]|nr:DUF4382 domain-containing protein [Bacteroidota bacterium]